MAVLGSSVGAVKEALYNGLSTALGDTASVLYDAPLKHGELLAGSQEWVGVWFEGEFEVDFKVPFSTGPVVVTEEDYELTLILIVLDEYRDPEGAAVLPGERGVRVDRRLDELIGGVLTWLNNSDNLPEVAGSANEITIEITALVEGSGTRLATWLDGQPGVRVARLELPINVSARRQIVTP